MCMFLYYLWLTVEGGLGYVFTSDRGYAVAVGNKERTPQTVRFELSPEALGEKPVQHGQLYVEGEAVSDATARSRDGRLELQVRLPEYGSAVWCAARDK